MNKKAIAELTSGIFDDEDEFESYSVAAVEGSCGRLIRSAEKRPTNADESGPPAKRGRENSPPSPTTSSSSPKRTKGELTLPLGIEQNQTTQTNGTATNNKTVRAPKTVRKAKKTQMFDKMCEDINSLGEKNKKIVAISNLLENTVYPVSSMRYHETRAQNLAVVFEIPEGLLYAPYKVAQYCLKEIFGIIGGDETGIKTTDWQPFVSTDGENRILTPGLAMRIKKASESKYPDMILMFNEVV